MKVAFLVALASLTACSSGAPTLYGDGPMIRPPVRAPSFNPTTDSPNPFERPETPRMQPQPRPIRVLPENPDTRKAPGIWASNPPRASISVMPPVIFGLPLDFPDDAPAPALAEFCATEMKSLATEYGWDVFRSFMTTEELRCLGAKLYGRCTEEYAKKNRDWLARSVAPNAINSGTIADMKSKAAGQVAIECKDLKKFKHRPQIEDADAVAGSLFRVRIERLEASHD